MLTYGTLFSGIDGFAVAFDRLGWDLRWQVELDDFCRAVLERHWPDVPKHADVRDVGAHNLARVDVLAGGFPCQDISMAGRGAGIDGERSGLWSEMFRVVRELRPRYVVVENVAALLARGLDRVLGDLASIGFDAEWDCIPASALGAPHRRDRLWLVAYPNGERLRADTNERHETARLTARGDLPKGDVGHAEGNGCGPRRQGRPNPTGAGQRESERPLQDADGSALQPWRVGGRAAQAGGAEWWAVEPPVGRVAHGVPNRLDQLAALGNALVPQIPEWIGQRIEEWEMSEQ